MLSFHAFKGTFSSINFLMPTELRDVAKGSLILPHLSGFWGGGAAAVLRPLACGDLSSPTMDRTRASCSGSAES